MNRVSGKSASSAGLVSQSHKFLSLHASKSRCWVESAAFACLALAALVCFASPSRANEECQARKDIAFMVMNLRQDGTPMEALMALYAEQRDKGSSSSGMLLEVILAAYGDPTIMPTPDLKERWARNFAAKQWLHCMPVAQP